MTGDNVIRVQRPVTAAQNYVGAQSYSQSYDNQLFLQGLFPDAEFDNLGGGFNGGFGGSIFGGNANMWGGGGTYADQQMNYMQMQANMEDFQADRTIARTKKAKYVELKTQSDEHMIAAKVAKLQNLIVENEQDQIPAARVELEAAVRENLTKILGEEPSEAEVKMEAKKYFEEGSGVGMSQAAKEADNGSFLHGFIRTSTLGVFGDKKTGAENAAEIDGTTVSRKNKTWEAIGNVLGAAAIATVGVLLFKRGGGAFRGTSHFMKQSKLASRVGSLESSLVQAQKAQKLAKDQAAKDQAKKTVEAIKDSITKLKKTHLDNDLAHQSKEVSRLIVK